MLSSLHIENIAVIERADVDFSQGFNVLTGETGAGKSIVIDAINAVLGMRTSKELIRSGCTTATVSALFTDVSAAAAEKAAFLGFDCESGEISIHRTLTDAKSTVKINGIATTSSIVRELSPYLINIHGQHDSQSLLDPDKHYIYIDLLASNADLLHKYQSAFSDMMNTRRQLKALTDACAENAKRRELLEYQINELEAADIKSGEISELKNRQSEISNAQSIISALQYSSSALYSEDDTPSALSLIDGAETALDDEADKSDKIAALSAELADIRYAADELRYKIEKLISDFEFDESEAEQIDERLDMYYRLRRKYGDTEQQMLDYLSSAKSELAVIDTSNEKISELNSILAPQVERVKSLGADLTASRQKAGEKFAADVAKRLKFLDMPNVRITVDIQPRPYSRLGADRVELLISTNPGEPQKPLSKIASGGEMSRIMLSIKNVLAEKDPVDTLIFDEIDAGISGRAAEKVGRTLKSTAAARQTICVTHLAQIAAKAATHLLIDKKIANGRAVTVITKLEGSGRREELARIIGSKVTSATLAAAEEMLREQ